MIELHYCATPNGMKIALMLEEAGLPHRIVPYDIFEGDQLRPGFGRINPNHKLPAIIDHDPGDGAPPLAVFESGAILIYLAEKSGQFLAPHGAARSRAMQWLIWQAAGLGPMGGQASHFLRYAPAGQEYAVDRYTRELDRLLTVLESRLSKSAFLAGEEYSIADMAAWPSRASSFVLGRDEPSRPATRRWYEAIAARPAVQRATARADLKAPEKYLGRHQKLTEAEWSNMFGDAMHAAVQSVD